MEGFQAKQAYYGIQATEPVFGYSSVLLLPFPNTFVFPRRVGSVPCLKAEATGAGSCRHKCFESKPKGS